MDKQSKRKLMLGILVATGTAIFVVGIFFVGSKQNLFSRTFRVSAIYNNLSGLRTGDNVNFSGVKAGIVEKITFLNDSMIKVDMKLDKSFQPLIKKDAVVYIATEGLVGNKEVNIKPVWKSRESIEDNGILASVNPFDSQGIIEKLINTNQNVSIITANLAKISTDMTEKKSIFKTLVNDSTSDKEFRNTLRNISTTSSQLITISSDIDKMVDKINPDSGVIGILMNDTIMKHELQETMANLKTSSAYSTQITGELLKGLQANNSNTWSVLMKDTAFAGNLKQSIDNLQQSTKKLNKTMDALQHSFLLRGYFKKHPGN
jgi:phospholipid/cholesterol/gamma-HCH transport system substrate-binding protein